MSLTDSSVKAPNYIVYGGAFDPPHQGHFDFCRLVLDRFKDARIAVVPTFSPPAVGSQQKLTSASYDNRVEMCRIHFEALIHQQRMVVDEIESRLPSPSYSLNTIQHLCRHPDALRLGFMMGMDQIKNFDRWHKPIEILKLCDLILISRPTNSDTPDLRALYQATKQCLDDLDVETQVISPDHWLLPQLQRSIYFIEQRASPAQSSLIRQAWAESKQETLKSWLRPEVLQYLWDHELYQAKVN